MVDLDLVYESNGHIESGRMDGDRLQIGAIRASELLLHVFIILFEFALARSIVPHPNRRVLLRQRAYDRPLYANVHARYLALMEAVRDHLVVDLVNQRLVLQPDDVLLVLLHILLRAANLPLHFEHLVDAVLLLDADNFYLPAFAALLEGVAAIEH